MLHIVRFTLLFFFVLIAAHPCIAQDTESKDDPTYIIVYIDLQVVESPCSLCYDSLSAKIKRIPGAKAVHADIVKSKVQFQLHSSMLVSEQELMQLAKESDLVPVQVLYEKEEPAEEEELIQF